MIGLWFLVATITPHGEQPITIQVPYPNNEECEVAKDYFDWLAVEPHSAVIDKKCEER